MSVNAPLVLRGFTAYSPAESGLAPGTIEGRIDGDEPFSAFAISKAILRRFDRTDGALGGFFSFQIVESEAENAKVLFDSSIELGVQPIALEDPLFSGIGLYAMFPLIDSRSSSWGKFRTRIVNGEVVQVIIQPDAKAAFDALPMPVAPAPAAPGPVILLGRKVQTITARMPALPERATSFTLQVADGPTTLPLEDSWMDFEAGLLPEDERVVSSTFVGALNADRLWFRLRAVNDSGSSLGPAIRDAEQEWAEDGITQLAGWAGWHHIWVPGEGPPTVYGESGSSYLDQTAFLSLNGFIEGLFGGPAYRMEAPAGAVIRVLSDAWGPTPSTIRDRFTFSVSFLPSEVGEACCQCPEIGKTFYLYNSSGSAKLAHTRHRATFDLANTDGDSDPTVFDFAALSLSLLYVEPALVALGGKSEGVVAALSLDDGFAWATINPASSSGSPGILVPNTKSLAACVLPGSGDIFLYALATATEITNDPDVPLDEQINQNDLLRCVLRPNSDSSRGGAYVLAERARITPGANTTLPSKGITGLFFHEGVFNLIARDGDTVRLFQSEDSLQNLREVAMIQSA